jgi:pimeloyl-ACP methyl ester carboxylesterase
MMARRFPVRDRPPAGDVAARRLTAQDHRVFAPTLTGVCERSHLNSPSVDLSTHIRDVVNEIRWKDLENVVLVGHSYGGMVISGVADHGLYLQFVPRSKEKLSSLAGSLASGSPKAG